MFGQRSWAPDLPILSSSSAIASSPPASMLTSTATSSSSGGSRRFTRSARHGAAAAAGRDARVPSSRLATAGLTNRRTKRQLISAERSDDAPLAVPLPLLSPEPRAPAPAAPAAAAAVLKETNRFRLSVTAATPSARPMPMASGAAFITLEEAHMRALGGPTLRQTLTACNRQVCGV